MAALTLRGDRVVLRGFASGELELMAEYIVGAGGDRERLERAVGNSGEWADEILYLAVEHDGRFAGAIDARKLADGGFELGIELVPAARGAGAGTAAVLLLTEHLLAAGATHVRAATPLENAAMRRVLETAAFTFEGELPNHWHGRDYALYVRLP